MKLWRTQCPNKMKIVLWRMAHNCLPTGDQLHLRSIPTRYDCSYCNRNEIAEHCFFHCHYVRGIWDEMKRSYDIRLKLRSFSNMRQCLLDWVSDASDFHMVVFAVAIWHIWENRNNVRNGEAVPHPPRLIGKTKGYIDCILMNDFRSTTSTRRENQSSI
jgi:hypothetical protein